MIIIVTVSIGLVMIMEINMTRIGMEMIEKSVYDFGMRVGMIWIMLI